VFSNETPAASGAAGKLSLMADDEDRMVATGPSLQGPGWGPDPDDDWLSGDVDWEETGETAAPGRAGRRGSAEAATMVSSPDGQAVSDVIRRRRMIALLAAQHRIGGVRQQIEGEHEHGGEFDPMARRAQASLEILDRIENAHPRADHRGGADPQAIGHCHPAGIRASLQ